MADPRLGPGKDMKNLEQLVPERKCSENGDTPKGHGGQFEENPTGLSDTKTLSIKISNVTNELYLLAQVRNHKDIQMG